MYEDTEFDTNLLVDIIRHEYFGIEHDQVIILMNDMFEKVKNDPYFFKLRPTMIFVNYIKYILMVVCKDETTISNLMSKLQYELLIFITDYKGPQIEMKISDIVINTYNKIEGAIPINVQ